MTDHDALLAAICAEPDEDTPRLAFADFLEENGRFEQAEFIRGQIQLARTPTWEPFAVACRRRSSDLVTGKRFRDQLVPLANGLEWHEEAFTRGFPWRLNVRSLHAWNLTAPALLGRVPIGRLHLWGGSTLDQWRDFARSPVIPRLREVHFPASPNEPLRVLRDAPAARGITDVYFERATGAGIPFVVEELLGSPLGQSLRGLHFHMGYESLHDLIAALGLATRLDRLSFNLMGLTDAHIAALRELPILGSLSELSLRGNKVGSDGILLLATAVGAFELQSLDLSGTGAAGNGLEALASVPGLARLRRLDLNRNPLSPRGARVLARSRVLAGLRSLNLSSCHVGERELFHLTRAKFWPNLVELDLRDNPLTRAGIRHLLDAPVPDDLAALVLSGHRIGEESRSELHRHYGDRVVFAAS